MTGLSIAPHFVRKFYQIRKESASWGTNLFQETHCKKSLLAATNKATRRTVALLSAGLFLTFSAANAADVTTYTYDEARSGAENVGELTTVSNDAAIIRLNYDARGNVISKSWEVDGTTYTQTFAYAPHDELVRRTFADGDTIPSATGSYQYDEYGNLKGIPGLVNNITRNAEFDPVATTYANGVTETRVYDQNRRWLNSITTKSGSNTLFSENYTRNNKGLITEVTSNRTNGDWKYDYDTADRLKSATNLNSSDFTQTFQYDAADNVTYNSAVGNYTYPAPTAPRPHAVTQAGGQSYTYDSNGNQTSGGGRLISYDGENRPVSITYGGKTTTFIYGPDGKRLKKISEGKTTLYLGADEEITSEGTHVKHPYAGVRKTGNTVNWLHRDHLSSVKLMTNASAAVISENFFRPYGERSDTQVAVGLPRESKGWIGERDDPETGLTYLNARYYDPVLARFISPDWLDPQDPGVGTNRFTYAMNNPIWLKDPSGNRIGGYDALDNPGGRIGPGSSGSSSGSSGGWFFSGGGSHSSYAGNSNSSRGTRSEINRSGNSALARLISGNFFGGVSGQVGTNNYQRVACRGGCVRAPGANHIGPGRPPLPGLQSSAPKTYQTYVKVHPKTGQVYVGRTSGYGSPRDNVAARDRNHHMKEFGVAKLDKSSSNAAAIRGREQQMIDKHGGAQSQGGTSGNRYNGISPKNDNRNYYLSEANKARFDP